MKKTLHSLFLEIKKVIDKMLDYEHLQRDILLAYVCMIYLTWI